MMVTQKNPKQNNLLSLPYLSNLNLSNLQSFLVCIIIFLIPTQLGKHFWPDFAYVFSLKIDYFSPTLYIWDILVVMLLLSWILLKPSINRSALTIFFVFMLLQLPSFFISENTGASFVRFYQYAIAGLFGIYLASKDWQFLKKPIYFGIVFGITVQSLIAYFEFLNGRSLGIWLLGERTFSLSTPSIATFNFYGQVFLRPYSSTPHPNVLAGYLVVMSTWLIFFINQKFYKRLSTAVLFISFFTTILTFSRAAMIVMVLNMFFFLRSFKKIILLTLIFLPFIFVRFSSAFNFDIISLQRRNDLALSAFNFFVDSPVFGIGLNNYISQMAFSDLISGPSRFLQPVHNIFLLSLSETGLVGFIGLCVLLTPFFIISKNILFRRIFTAANIVIFVSFITIFFLGSFDHYFLTIPTGQRLLFFCWGLSMLEYFRWKH